MHIGMTSFEINPINVDL